MICPWKKRTERYSNSNKYEKKREISKESFCDCDEDECPFYINDEAWIRERLSGNKTAVRCRRVNNG